jgi:spore coat protein A, manganese oxidase
MRRQSEKQQQQKPPHQHLARRISTSAIIVLKTATTLLMTTFPAHAKRLLPTLSDPDMQPKFVSHMPNLLDQKYFFSLGDDVDPNTTNGAIGTTTIQMKASIGKAYTGLVRSRDDNSGELEPVATPFFGYGPLNGEPSWPGPTLVVQTNQTLQVEWHNRLPKYHILSSSNNSLNDPGHHYQSAVDPSIHWCYSLEGYQQFTIEEHGVPMVPHLHGGHTDATSDGNPEVRNI